MVDSLLPTIGGEMMKILCSRVTAKLLFGLLCAIAPSAAPQAPSPSVPTASAAAASQEQVSPEEKRKRKDWNDSMMRKAAPKKGCFNAAYPSVEWKEVTCVKSPNLPALPRRGPRPAV